MNTSIFQIQKEYIDIINRIIDNDAEVDDNMMNEIEQLNNQLEVKGENYYYIIKQMSGEIDIISNEIERLRKLKQTRENIINRLKENLINAMGIMGIDKIKTEKLSISIRENVSVDIIDEDSVESKYVTWYRKIDKRMIHDDIKNGVAVNGVELKKSKSLMMR